MSTENSRTSSTAFEDKARTKKKKGTYLGWKYVEPTTVSFSEETDTPLILETPSDESPRCLGPDMQQDDSIGFTNYFSEQATSSCSNIHSKPKTPPNEYVLPVNDENDHWIDDLFNELNDVARLEREHELIDDIESEPLSFMAEHMVETTEFTSEPMQTANNPLDQSPEDLPLFEGSKRFLGVTMLLLCCFMIKFRLSDEAMEYLFTLLSLLLPDENKLVRSMYGLRQFLKKHTNLHEIRYYCSWCYTHVTKDDKRCTNAHCLKDLTKPGSLSYFVIHSLISQLRSMFQRKSFTETVRQHRFSHYRNAVKGTISDIYDGENYKALYNSGFLSDKNSLSFGMNTDGVALFKSSKVSMWPAYLMINELPIHERKARENMLFYGVWISTKKPQMWSFLKPMYDEFKQLEEGVAIVDYANDEFICNATLLTVTCDLPAKCLVSNSVHFNGKHGCWYCLQPGENFRTGKGGNCHVFPCHIENPTGPPRTVKSVELDVNSAITKIQSGEKNYVCNGLKGPSWFLFLKHFNVIEVYVIDYMHGVCAGIMKLLLKLWFSKENKDEKFSLFLHRDHINRNLVKIKPTITVTRVPRSLDDLVHWKSSEYRNFLMYWGLPLLFNFMSEVYFLHFIVLVKSIFLLSKESVTVTDLISADECIHQFVESFQELYGLQYLTMNLHQLVHLARNVVANGPLFANNCFVFEDFNGYIIQHIHGTQGIDTQIINTINIIQAVPILCEKYLQEDTEESEFYNSLMVASSGNRILIENGVYGIGPVSYIDLSAKDYALINESFTMANFRVKCFQKVFMSNKKFYVYSQQYIRMQRRNQSVLKYQHENQHAFGIVKQFLQFEDAGRIICNIALICPIKYLQEICVDVSHKAVPQWDKIAVVSVIDLLSSCILVEANGNFFICEVANQYDRD